MPEIKRKKLNFKKNRQGVALILVILLMTVILFLSLYFLSFTLTEKKISRSQAEGVKTYYLAEAGVNEMVWRLKNNPAYKTNFETNPSWTASFTRTDPLGPGSGSYTVTIANSAVAHGEITAVAAINLAGGGSQRIVKTSVYRALGSGSVELGDNGGYADGNIDISLSMVNFYNGSAHSNNDFTINNASTVNIQGNLNAVNNYLKSWLSTVNVSGAIHAHNYPPAAASLAMPAVDFDSADSNSFKSRASVVYSESDFDTLMQNNQNLILNNPITYVEGDVELRGAQNLTINGLLVVGRDFKVGVRLCRGFRCGQSALTVNHAAGQPSGVLAKRKVNFQIFTGNVNVNGVIYANDQMDILSFPLGYQFSINGGLVSRKLTVSSSWQPISITRNEEIINSTLAIMDLSPVITVEHWEEEY